ncbi:hypothetical protein CEB3_c32450 [Peptococcaceae bacterium CEB3]|nr:hypothetical protein CEB3_c32450 [Peptococcaceae bacterium CEB3]
MEQKSYESLRVWAWRLSVGTALMVGLLSFVQGVGFLGLMLRLPLTFFIMYALSAGSLYLFRKGSADAGLGSEASDGKGNLFDIVLGAETAATAPGAGAVADSGLAADAATADAATADAADAGAESAAPEKGAPALFRGLPGQVDAGLGEGLPDPAQQARIVRHMGWKD